MTISAPIFRTGAHGAVGQVSDTAAGSSAPPSSLLSMRYLLGFFGADRTRRLLAGAGLHDGAGPLPDTVTKVAFWHLCVENMQATNDEGCGATPQALPRWSWATLFSMVNQMETLGEGLRKLAELTLVVPAGIGVTLSHSAAGVHVNFRPTGPGDDLERRERYLEAVALGFHCMLLWVSAAAIRPVQLRLSGNLDEADGSLLSGLAEKRTRNGSGATIVYDRADLSLPLGVRKYQAWCAHETTTFLQIVALLDRDRGVRPSPIVDTLRQLLRGSPLSQGQAACAIGVSVATLRRRLAEAGTSFRAVSQSVRVERLTTLLATDACLDDIAVEVGFSDRRSLWRTCYDWLGVSPTVYRRNRRALPAVA